MRVAREVDPIFSQERARIRPLIPVLGRDDLDALTAEVLPERAVLSTVFAGSGSAWQLLSGVGESLHDVTTEVSKGLDGWAAETRAGLDGWAAETRAELDGVAAQVGDDLVAAEVGEGFDGLTVEPSTVPPASDIPQEFSASSMELLNGVSDGHGTTVYYACSFAHSEGTQGVLGSLGLGTPSYSTGVCMPAAIVWHSD